MKKTSSIALCLLFVVLLLAGCTERREIEPAAEAHMKYAIEIFSSDARKALQVYDTNLVVLKDSNVNLSDSCAEQMAEICFRGQIAKIIPLSPMSRVQIFTMGTEEYIACSLENDRVLYYLVPDFAESYPTIYALWIDGVDSQNGALLYYNDCESENWNPARTD